MQPIDVATAMSFQGLLSSDSGGIIKIAAFLGFQVALVVVEATASLAGMVSRSFSHSVIFGISGHS